MLNKRLINTGEAAPAPLDPLQNFETVTYTGNGSTQKITGYIRKGAAFNGSSSKITNSSLAVNTSNSFSISLWVYPQADNTYQRLLQFGNHGTEFLIQKRGDNNKARLLARITNTIQVDLDGAVLTNNQWHHIAVTVDGTTASLYVNNLSPLTDNSFNAQNYTGLYIGHGQDNREFTNGKIDQVRIFNTALNSTQVGELALETYADPKKSTTDYFGDGSGVALYELDEDANNANDTGTVANVSEEYARADMPILTDADFDGTASSGQTISFWFKSDTASNNDVILGSNTVRNGALYGSSILVGQTTGVYADESISFWDYDGSTTSVIQVRNGHNAYKDGAYRHFAMVSTPTTKAIYINGVSQTLTYQQSGSATANFKLTDIIIGDTTGLTYNKPTGVKELRIFEDALTSTEVGYLYNENASQIALLDNKLEYASFLYNGTPTNVNFLGMAFQPDWVWIKDRDTSNRSHVLVDSVRGATNQLSSDNTNIELVRTSVTAFDSNGFTVGNYTPVNESGNNYVAWCWKAGGAAVLNENGSIDSQVSANTDAGFSIVKWTADGNGFSSDIGHGLTSAPELIISKDTDTANDWIVTSSLFSNTVRNFLKLNLSDAIGTSGLDSYALTATTFKLAPRNNTIGKEIISYCFHSVDGYQKVGSYQGTAVAGLEVTGLGFSPRFVMLKNTTSTGSWIIHSKPPTTTNPSVFHLRANTSGAEDNGANEQIDFDDDGFTLNGTGGNANSNNTYIYLAIA